MADLSLIERLEKATGPDREIDAQIALLIGVVPEGAFRPCAALDIGTFATGAYSFWTCERYTASVDAALTLAPEGAGMDIRRYWLARDEAWSVYLMWGCMPTKRAEVEDAPTLPLALCIAALRARTP